MTMRSDLIGFGLLFTLALAGCSSDAMAPGAGGASAGGAGGGSATCSVFTPCGGDLTGTWHASTTCLSDSATTALQESLKFCPAGTATLGTIKLTGTITIDGASVLYDEQALIGVVSAFPNSCLPAGKDCAEVQSAFAAQAGVSNAVCSKTATGCSCNYNQSIAAKQQTSYVKNGTSITETDASDGSTNASDYCVMGSTLRIKDKSSNDVYTR